MSMYINPLNSLMVFSMLLILKIADWFEIMVEIRDSEKYIDWIEDLEKFRYIIYTKYLYYVTSVSFIIYMFYDMFTKDSFITKILDLFLIIFILSMSSDFYKNTLKLKK